jgi:hypothetical protein
MHADRASRIAFLVQLEARARVARTPKVGDFLLRGLEVWGGILLFCLLLVALPNLGVGGDRVVFEITLRTGWAWGD